MNFNLLLSIHIIAFIMWTGSLLISSRIIALSAKNNQIDTIKTWSKKIVFGWMLPGMVISILTGLYQLTYKGVGFYMKQGWFHGKLTLIVLLIVISIMLIKFISNPKQDSKIPMVIHGVSGLSMFLIVFMTMILK